MLCVLMTVEHILCALIFWAIVLFGKNIKKLNFYKNYGKKFNIYKILFMITLITFYHYVGKQ